MVPVLPLALAPALALDSVPDSGLADLNSVMTQENQVELGLTLVSVFSLQSSLFIFPFTFDISRFTLHFYGLPD